MAEMSPLVFFGTPEFAVPTLAALVAAGRAPVCVVTQPSRPAGRGQQEQPPPVARWARDHGLTVLQPERVRSPEFLAQLRPLRPALGVVVAFGQIFPVELLALPEHGCLNLHASLLPAFRGASPIQAAVAAGETRTGVTVMRMEKGLDSGPILLQQETPLGAEETADELAARLAVLGADLMVAALAGLERGELTPQPQDGDRATYAPRLTRDSGRVDWTLTAAELANRLRAYTPWPGLTAELRGAPVKLVRARPAAPPPADLPTAPATTAAPSTPGAGAPAASATDATSGTDAMHATPAVSAPAISATRANPDNRETEEIQETSESRESPESLESVESLENQEIPETPKRSATPVPDAVASPSSILTALADIVTPHLGPAPGSYLGMSAGGATIACGSGSVLAVAELQRPGRKAQRAEDFVNGERLRIGEVFS